MQQKKGDGTNKKRIILTPLYLLILFTIGCISHSNRSKPIDEKDMPIPTPLDRILYNGIELPDEWPPCNLDAKSKEPMRVPYLENPPAVIPIDIGRQLFVDDFLVETTSLRRVYHAANEYPGNPVFIPSSETELHRTRGSEGEQEAVCYLGTGGVFYDPKESLIKMWYTAGWRGALALATSSDGITWTRPPLNAKGENIVLPAGENEPFAGWDNTVYLDAASKIEAERYKFLSQRPEQGHSHTLHTSKDGFEWSQGVQTGLAADYCTFFFNPFRNVWVHSIKRNGPRGRARDYAESQVFMDPDIYDHSVYWVNADCFDQPDPEVGDEPQLYMLHGIAYESILLGMFQIHLGPHNRVCEEGKFPKITELKLGYSRDGFHWDRPEREPFIKATRKEGDWNRAYLHSTAGICLVAGDWLYFPCTGYSGVSSSGWEGMYTGARIGMMILRRDGFASMETGVDGGVLTTRPVCFSGRRMFVNIDCPGGELRVEILDTAGMPISGFSKDDCLPVSVDKTLMAIAWKSGSDLTTLVNKPVRFRFYLNNGKLYSFWVSRDESGASLGFVAAGGPGYNKTYDDKGISAYNTAAKHMPEKGFH